LPGFRRQWIATAILNRVREWVDGQGAIGLALQVGSSNEAAKETYRQRGFTTAYTYHYRQQPSERQVDPVARPINPTET
ncbi:MAG: GNAT family N-acetyltransferase, partial [Okeania sp. SIO3C4]|nr:GNAT family N-acetyltransferase [Okeania sp. SIO3C4]